MKINSDFLINTSVDGNIYANDFKCKNLIENKLPTTTNAGITCTKNNDGTYTINGTATNDVTFRLDQSTQIGRDNLKSYPAGSYTFSCPELINGMQLVMMTDVSYVIYGRMFDSTPVTFTLNNTLDNVFIYIYVRQNTVVNNITIHPQLEIGTIATKWVPYKSYANIIPTKKWTGIGVNSTYCHTTDFAYQCCIIGNYAFVNIGSVAFKTGDVPNYATILTGLPPAKQYYTCHLLGGVGTIQHPCIRVGINDNGNMQTHWTGGIAYNTDTSANTQYTGTFVYEIKN